MTCASAFSVVVFRAPNSPGNLAAAHKSRARPCRSLTFFMLPQRVRAGIPLPHKLRREAVVRTPQLPPAAGRPPYPQCASRGVSDIRDDLTSPAAAPPATFTAFWRYKTVETRALFGTNAVKVCLERGRRRKRASISGRQRRVGRVVRGWRGTDASQDVWQAVRAPRQAVRAPMRRWTGARSRYGRAVAGLAPRPRAAPHGLRLTEAADDLLAE